MANTFERSKEVKRCPDNSPHKLDPNYYRKGDKTLNIYVLRGAKSMGIDCRGTKWNKTGGWALAVILFALRGALWVEVRHYSEIWLEKCFMSKVELCFAPLLSPVTTQLTILLGYNYASAMNGKWQYWSSYKNEWQEQQSISPRGLKCTLLFVPTLFVRNLVLDDSLERQRETLEAIHDFKLKPSKNIFASPVKKWGTARPWAWLIWFAIVKRCALIFYFFTFFPWNRVGWLKSKHQL